MSVYEEEAYPFLKAEEAFIRQALIDGVPLLGIRLGGQLLAKALGCPVTRDGVKEIGWHGISLNEIGQRDPLFGGLPERFTVFQWHGDAFHAPVGTVQLTSSPASRNQAVRFGGLVYGLQFHLGVTPPMVEEWLREYAGELTGLGEPVDPGRLLEETPDQCEKLRSVSRQVFQNFLRLVRLRASKPESPTLDPAPRVELQGSGGDPRVDRAWQRYRELVARGRLRCGVTCPLDRIGHCTGGCW